MKRSLVILIFIVISAAAINGQKFQFGIQYMPLQASKISFDQDYIIFDDYSSLKTLKPAFRISIPSLSNSGLFLRYNTKHITFQTGANFQNNVYFFSEKSTYSSGTSISFFYSSVDIPLTAAFTFNTDEKVKYRILAGGNFKLFKFKRNYYSVFAKSFDYINYAEEAASDKGRREFMVTKINPIILYARAGIGIQYYNITADLCLDKNLTNMNRQVDKYNANFIDSYQVNIILGFRIAPGDLKDKTRQLKIAKQ